MWDQKFKALRKSFEEDAIIGEIVCDYSEAINQGKPVSKESLLARASTPKIRRRAQELLDLSDLLIEIGRRAGRRK